MRPSPLGLKIFGFTAIVIAVSLGVALLVVRRVAGSAADASIERALAASAAAIDDKLSARSQTLRATTVRLVQVPTYVARVEAALGAADHGDLLDAVEELAAQLGTEWVLVTDAGGMLAAWSDRPDRAGIQLAGGALVDLPLQGAVAEGLWLEPDSAGETIYQAVGVPLRAPGRDVPLGAVVAALRIDATLAAALHRNTGSEIVFFTRDRDGAAVPNVGTVAAGPAVAGALGADTSLIRVGIEAAGDRWVGSVGTLRSAAGAPLGGFVGLRSRSAELAPYLRLERVITASLVGGLLLALAASAWLAGRIVRPVRSLVQATRKIGAGDYSMSVSVDSQDEIGELGRAFGRMLSELGEKQRLVDYLSRTGTTPPPVPGADAGSPEGSSALAVGDVVANRYLLQEQLGAGGMGVVFRAFDRDLGEPVALKTLHPRLQLADPVLLERFKQEIRLARRITHRNVVRTHDLGEAEGVLFLTMELVEGTSLDQLIKRRGALPAEVVVQIAKQLLRALDAAHEVGVIHRDVKPGNLIVQPSGFVKVMDFGIARLAEPAAASEPALTRAGMIVGSPDYMAPEQLLGESIDHRIDIYATGVLMFEALTTRRLHDAPNVMALISRHLEQAGPDAGVLAELPDGLGSVIERAISRDPERRWPSAAAMLEALTGAD